MAEGQGAKNDLEKASVSDVQTPNYRTNSGPQPNYEATTEVLPQSYFSRFIDTFRRDENQSVTPRGAIGADGRVYDPGNAALATATSPLQRNLKSRHLQMIAIGGSIGECLPYGSIYGSLTVIRNWSLHCFWQSVKHWRTRFALYRFRPYRNHALQYDPSSW